MFSEVRYYLILIIFQIRFNNSLRFWFKYELEYSRLSKLWQAPVSQAFNFAYSGGFMLKCHKYQLFLDPELFKNDAN